MNSKVYSIICLFTDFFIFIIIFPHGTWLKLFVENPTIADFSVEQIWNIPKTMQLGKLKYVGQMLLETLLGGICKAAGAAAPFISFGADWLNPK